MQKLRKLFTKENGVSSKRTRETFLPLNSVESSRGVEASNGARTIRTVYGKDLMAKIVFFSKRAALTRSGRPSDFDKNRVKALICDDSRQSNPGID